MNTYIDCVPCLVRQAVDAVRLVTDNTDIQAVVLRDVLSALREVDYGQPAPVMARRIHRIIRSHLRAADPYQAIKQMSNTRALEMYPTFRKRVLESSAPFDMAVRLAIAGNIIDYGTASSLGIEMIDSTIDNALSAEIPHEELESLRESIASAKSILYLADNAGEIVFDRLLIEQMPLEKVTVAVRGTPVINDATPEDAKAAGLTELVRVIDNGADIPGTIPDECSPEFRRLFDSADLIISKGQGNLETLHGLPKNICYLLLAKCPLVARELGCQVGKVIVHNSNLHSPAPIVAGC